MSNQQFAEKHTLNSVTISKDSLLQVLRENQEAHNEVFKAATQAYVDAVRTYLERVQANTKRLARVVKERLKAVGSDNALDPLPNPFISAPQKPVSHEDSYHAAIRKVELSVHTEFTLDEQDFNQYVLNNWSWSTSFIANATHYSTGIHAAAVSGSLQKFRR